jgi:hypothetical protein
MNTTLIQKNYTATVDDYYIGVDSTSSLTITLPECEDGKQYIIKSEMKPPLLNRHIKIVSADDSKFDGYSEFIISVSHGSVTLIRHRGNWFVCKS